ncbi:HEPN domain-containing protein [Paenibacillus sp. SYP-B4298]|uniref:HEPN domain-containing protein n=1 Tax=Paenibacillus sp. SYP-B4298 TaxID=2996034 RepID=UPI0022DD90F7|nr:HEPN domain-containing protein [Paenibacillus sp. SYP-B4298]
MQAFISENIEFQKNLDVLVKYIEFNKNNQSANYGEYRDIVYGAIINRGYTLWESFVKEIFFIYFSLKKVEFYDNNTIIEKYRINELPGFLFEQALFDKQQEKISFQLNKSILTFTSKNIDMSELAKLFKRVDLDVQAELNNNLELKHAVLTFDVAFENGLLEENKPTQALKRLIQERNLVSHYAHIDQFQSIDILLEWVKYYKLLGKILSKVICLEYVRTIETDKKEVGECKNVLSNNLILLDTAPQVEIKMSTKIYIYNSSNKLIDIVIPKSFMVENKVVETVPEMSKAGIKVESVFDSGLKYSEGHKYYIMANVF